MSTWTVRGSLRDPRIYAALQELRRLLEREEKAKLLHRVDWVILPPGELERRVLPEAQERAKRKNASSWRKEWPQRLAFLLRLDPNDWVEGKEQKVMGRRYYLIALFYHRNGGIMAVAESPQYGNAIYCCGDDWGNILPLTKAEARAAGAIRICHQKGWQSDLKDLLYRFGIFGSSIFKGSKPLVTRSRPWKESSKP